jgi:rhodanese-related sulfurtransferase
MQTITRNDLARLIDTAAPLVLLEALPERYFNEGHLPGARLFPLDQVRSLAPRLLPEPGVPVVVYCASDTCRNSHTAAALLHTLGYQNVRVYEGGKADWCAAGLTLES